MSRQSLTEAWTQVRYGRVEYATAFQIHKLVSQLGGCLFQRQVGSTQFGRLRAGRKTITRMAVFVKWRDTGRRNRDWSVNLFEAWQHVVCNRFLRDFRGDTRYESRDRERTCVGITGNDFVLGCNVLKASERLSQEGDNDCPFLGTGTVSGS
jgi:hypothetical protein